MPTTGIVATAVAAALVCNLAVGWLVYRIVVRLLASRIMEMMADVVEEPFQEMDRRLRKVEAIVVRDLLKGGPLFEAAMEDVDMAGVDADEEEGEKPDGN